MESNFFEILEENLYKDTSIELLEQHTQSFRFNLNSLSYAEKINAQDMFFLEEVNYILINR